MRVVELPEVAEKLLRSRNEIAVRQETALLVLSIPVAYWLADGVLWFGILVGSIVALLIVEVLNTGLEAACNAISREYDLNIQIAKDFRCEIA